MQNKDFIYIPFNKAVKNILSEMESLSTNLFGVNTNWSTDHRTLTIDSNDMELVSVAVNPVYVIIRKNSENQLATELYNTLMLKTKASCN